MRRTIGSCRTKRPPARSAGRNRSRLTPVDSRGRRHTSRITAITATQHAFAANTAGTPRVAMSAPATAGPTARATLTLIMSSRAAAPISSRRTTSGISDCQVGTCSAMPTPSANVNERSSGAEIAPWKPSNAKGGGDGDRVALHEEQQPAPIEDVGQHSGGERQQHHGQRGRRLDQSHDRGRVRIVHEQPLRADRLHPRANAADRHAKPQPEEGPVAQRRERRVEAHHARRFSGHCAMFARRGRVRQPSGSCGPDTSSTSSSATDNPSTLGCRGASLPSTCSPRKPSTTSYHTFACPGLSTQWFSSGK